MKDREMMLDIPKISIWKQNPLNQSRRPTRQRKRILKMVKNMKIEAGSLKSTKKEITTCTHGSNVQI